MYQCVVVPVPKFCYAFAWNVVECTRLRECMAWCVLKIALNHSQLSYLLRKGLSSSSSQWLCWLYCISLSSYGRHPRFRICTQHQYGQSPYSFQRSDGLTLFEGVKLMTQVDLSLFCAEFFQVEATAEGNRQHEKIVLRMTYVTQSVCRFAHIFPTRTSRPAKTILRRRCCV